LNLGGGRGFQARGGDYEKGLKGGSVESEKRKLVRQ